MSKSWLHVDKPGAIGWKSLICRHVVRKIPWKRDVGDILPFSPEMDYVRSSINIEMDEERERETRHLRRHEK